MVTFDSDFQQCYQIMSDQPDCCGECGRRLDLMEITEIDGEPVFRSRCNDCQRDILVVEG